MPPRRWTTFGATTRIVFFMVLFAAACVMPMQSDTWWHLRAGQEMWARHFIMLADEFSFTVTGAYWPNHEWLSELVFFLVYRTAGLPGLTIVGAACLTAAVALSWSLMRGTPLARVLFMAAAIPSLVLVWTVRPHVFTLLLLMIVVHCLLKTMYWPLPIVFGIWANLHGGVALGLVAVGAVALSDGWMVGRRRFLGLAVLSIACFAATFVTPLGIDLWTTIPESIHKSVANGILEWRPPMLFGWRDLSFWVIAGLMIGALAARRGVITTREDAAVIAVALALLPLALRYSRNITPFVLLAVPALSRMLTSAAPDARASARNERHQLNAAFLTVCAVASTIGVIGAWSARSEHLQWEPLSGPIVTAIRACPGHLYNRFDDGGYLIWFAPGVPVFVDNRQDPYPLAFLQDHLHHERSGDFEPVFARYALRCAFLPPESPTAQHLISSGQWSVTARDARWLVLRAR